MNTLILYIGNKNYSSWSMRAWLGLKYLNLDFETHLIPLRTNTSKETINNISPSGWVPCLHHGDLRVCDSLAILEYAHELVPNKNLLPDSTQLRAIARSAVSEMHSGFFSLRNECPMDIRRRESKELSPQAMNDINRIYKLWDYCKVNGNQGPYLLGEFSIVDAFYAPVISRILSYNIDKRHHCEYINVISHLDLYQEWENAAVNEPWIL